MRDIWVDFNSVEPGNNWVRTLSIFAEPGVHLECGVGLTAGDDEGNFARATVLSVDDKGVVLLSLDMGTFTADQDTLTDRERVC